MQFDVRRLGLQVVPCRRKRTRYGRRNYDQQCPTLSVAMAVGGTAKPPELRSAAALILGEVGDKDPELNAALTSALDDPEPAVRAQAIIAIGKLKIDQTLPKLLARITEGGIESELAAQAAARLGAKGT